MSPPSFSLKNLFCQRPTDTAGTVEVNQQHRDAGALNDRLGLFVTLVGDILRQDDHRVGGG